VGPQGVTGPSCCKEGLYIALQQLLDSTATLGVENVELRSFNDNVGGNGYVITAVTEDIVTIEDGQGPENVSICNITGVFFDTTVPLTAQDPITTLTEGSVTVPGNVDYCGLVNDPILGPAVVCGCNEGLVGALATATELQIVDNSNAFINIESILGICTDMIWIEVDGGAFEYAAIPLCSVLRWR
jgi:hypothetical protein